MVQSIERAMKIIHTLISDNRKTSWTLSEISEKAGLPQSSVHRLINTLKKHGLISQSPVTKQYKIGHTWMEVGFWLHEHLDFREVARPIMERLAEEVQESVYFSVPNGDFATIIDRVDSPLSVRIIDNLGERIPLTIGAANKSMLAFMKPEKAQQIIDGLMATNSEKSILLSQLEKIRREGCAISYGEKTEGTFSIAAPVFSFDHQVVGSVYINLLADKKTKNRASLAEKVMNAAKEISDQTGKAPY
ncbi:MAG TPA: IclR family transcriptional regulator [Bacillales bacterium]|nr:IclR family transcriptional regulator [Bacillales bacterium]